MCLSTVYDENKNLLCENVMMVQNREDGRLDFYNILGVCTSYYGFIEKINLMDNCISVRTDPTRAAK